MHAVGVPAGAAGGNAAMTTINADTINADRINAREIDSFLIDVVRANATTINATTLNASAVAATSVGADTITANATVTANAVSAATSLAGNSLVLRGEAGGIVSLAAAPAAAPAGSYTLVLPGEQAATGQVLANDGSGGLFWVSAITQQTYVAGTVFVPVCISRGVYSGKVPCSGDFDAANKRTLGSTACRVNAFWPARGKDPKAYTVNLNRHGDGNNDTAPVRMTEMTDGAITFRLEKNGPGVVQDVELSIVVFY